MTATVSPTRSIRREYQHPDGRVRALVYIAHRTGMHTVERHGAEDFPTAFRFECVESARLKWGRLHDACVAAGFEPLRDGGR